MENESILLKARVHQEIDLLPHDSLDEIYDMIHNYRLELETAGQLTPKATSILQLAGSWSDLPDADFALFMDEIQQRRRRAFMGRPSRGTRPD